MRNHGEYAKPRRSPPTRASSPIPDLQPAAPRSRAAAGNWRNSTGTYYRSTAARPIGSSRAATGPAGRTFHSTGSGLRSSISGSARRTTHPSESGGSGTATGSAGSGTSPLPRIAASARARRAVASTRYGGSHRTDTIPMNHSPVLSPRGSRRMFLNPLPPQVSQFFPQGMGHCHGPSDVKPVD